MSWLDATEARALAGLQSTGCSRPATCAARTLSRAGEHAWLWLALSGAGYSLDRPRRSEWAQVGASALIAHGGAVVLKRIVRRKRPHAPGLLVLDRTASLLSFPSAHASSTTAAAMAAAPLLGARRTAPVVVSLAMALARMLLGVHYPSDVAAGAIIGVLSVRAVRCVAGAWRR